MCTIKILQALAKFYTIEHELCLPFSEDEKIFQTNSFSPKTKTVLRIFCFSKKQTIFYMIQLFRAQETSARDNDSPEMRTDSVLRDSWEIWIQWSQPSVRCISCPSSFRLQPQINYRSSFVRRSMATRNGWKSSVGDPLKITVVVGRRLVHGIECDHHDEFRSSALLLAFGVKSINTGKKRLSRAVSVVWITWYFFVSFLLLPVHADALKT